jgi:hypothetical protein
MPVTVPGISSGMRGIRHSEDLSFQAHGRGNQIADSGIGNGKEIDCLQIRSEGLFHGKEDHIF